MTTASGTAREHARRAAPDDTLVPVDTARRLAQALPAASLQLVEEAGHHLPR
jgi:pimeloyl-ACP methyl ester carboxylesterase